jgi:hypothetical protein
LLLATTVYGEAILFNPPTGNITAIEPEATQFDATRILGSRVYSDVDWAVLSIGHGTDCWNYVENTYTNDETGEVTTNLNRVVKANISEVSDFVNTKLAWEKEQAIKEITLQSIRDSIWEIATKYGVTNSPLNWFTLKAELKQQALTNAVAIADGAEVTSLSLLYKEWGGNLFNVTK